VAAAGVRVASATVALGTAVLVLTEAEVAEALTVAAVGLLFTAIVGLVLPEFAGAQAEKAAAHRRRTRMAETTRFVVVLRMGVILGILSRDRLSCTR